MEHETKVVEIGCRHIIGLIAVIMLVPSTVVALLGGPWRAVLGWEIWGICLITFYVCGRNALTSYENREHDKHYASRKEGRKMLYSIILWAVGGVLIMASGIVVSELIDPHGLFS